MSTLSGLLWCPHTQLATRVRALHAGTEANSHRSRTNCHDPMLLSAPSSLSPSLLSAPSQQHIVGMLSRSSPSAAHVTLAADLPTGHHYAGLAVTVALDRSAGRYFATSGRAFEPQFSPRPPPSSVPVAHARINHGPDYSQPHCHPLLRRSRALLLAGSPLRAPFQHGQGDGSGAAAAGGGVGVLRIGLGLDHRRSVGACSRDGASRRAKVREADD